MNPCVHIPGFTSLVIAPEGVDSHSRSGREHLCAGPGPRVAYDLAPRS